MAPRSNIKAASAPDNQVEVGLIKERIVNAKKDRENQIVAKFAAYDAWKKKNPAGPRAPYDAALKEIKKIDAKLLELHTELASLNPNPLVESKKPGSKPRSKRDRNNSVSDQPPPPAKKSRSDTGSAGPNTDSNDSLNQPSTSASNTEKQVENQSHHQTTSGTSPSANGATIRDSPTAEQPTAEPKANDHGAISVGVVGQVKSLVNDGDQELGDADADGEPDPETLTTPPNQPVSGAKAKKGEGVKKTKAKNSAKTKSEDSEKRIRIVKWDELTHAKQEKLKRNGSEAYQKYIRTKGAHEIPFEVRTWFRRESFFMPELGTTSRRLAEICLTNINGFIICPFHCKNDKDNQLHTNDISAKKNGAPILFTGVPYPRLVWKGEDLKPAVSTPVPGSMNCGCLLDEVLLDLFFWKSGTLRSASTGVVEDWGPNPLRPRDRAFVCDSIRDVGAIKVDDIYAYDGNWKKRTEADSLQLQIDNLVRLKKESVERQERKERKERENEESSDEDE